MICMGGDYSVLQESEHNPVGILSRVTKQLLQQLKHSVAARMMFSFGKCVSQVLTIHICEDIAWVDRVDSNTILSM